MSFLFMLRIFQLRIQVSLIYIFHIIKHVIKIKN